MRLVLHAPNIHQGGGLVLLSELIPAIPDKSFLILDARLRIPLDSLKKFDIYIVKPTIWGRFKAECKLKLIAGNSDRVLCFGNLPPLFSLRADATLFLQNRLTIDKRYSLKGFGRRIFARITLERCWFWLRQKNVKQFVVQSKSMQKIVRSVLNCEAKILPFPNSLSSAPEKEIPGNIKEVDFAYIATGEPYKNHKKLILAWVELSSHGIYPSLCLTVNRNTHPSLCDWIEEISLKYQLKLTNLGSIPRLEVLSLYRKTKALIFPSLVESFGLPLVEASQLGLPIIASELDFVRDVVCPKETFDPNSVVSITRAVRRFLCKSEPSIPLLTAEEFIANTISV
jgi:glycosyltransferase involved in cell wall biosynthesis